MPHSGSEDERVLLWSIPRTQRQLDLKCRDTVETDDKSRSTHQCKNRQAANGRRAIRTRLDCSATRRTIHQRNLKEDEPAAMVIRPLLKTVIL